MVGKIAFLFPGQGSQIVGMGKAAREAVPAAKALFETADQVLGFSLSEIMFNGPEDRLRQTDVTQPALFVASAAALEQVKARGLAASWHAGHSLGEYSALYAAGVLKFDDALRLVRLRGEAMQKAAVERPGAMAAVLGLDEGRVTDLCAQASAAGVCVPANFNSNAQTVISGEKEAVAKAMELATAAGAPKVVALNVSGAFHSPLMSPAVEAMRGPISSAAFKKATAPVITNVDAEPTTEPAAFPQKLLQQIDHPVRWNQTLKRLIALGAETFIEVGSGKVLGTLVKKLDRKKAVYFTDEFEALEKAVAGPATA